MPFDSKADLSANGRKEGIYMIKYKFDTTVQHIKYQVLREVARHAWEDDLLAHLLDIPKDVVPIDEPNSEFDAYKELAVLSERVKLAIGGDGSNPNIIQALDVACNKCPTGGYTVTDFCRGCLAITVMPYVPVTQLPWTNTITHTLTKANALTVVSVQASVLSPRLSIKRDPASSPVKRAPSP